MRTRPRARQESIAASFRGLGEIAAGGPPATIGAASCAGRVCGWGTSGEFGPLLLTELKTGRTILSEVTANGSVLWGGAFVKLARAWTFWHVGSGYPIFDTGAA